MADQQNTDLPEGTDTVIAGASNDASDSHPGQSGQERAMPDTTLVEDRSAKIGGSGSNGGGSIADRIRSGREQFANQAGDKARGLVTQGLERTSEALANVAKMVGETATGIDDRLGNEYGDYARRAAGTIENVANAIAEKDPDELIEDTRNFVRNSPGIALAGAAVVGFVVARLVKSGLASSRAGDDND
jgi:ElaB/YqjD/DUF883 family membrane-anchored ribosome-binding protein